MFACGTPCAAMGHVPHSRPLAGFPERIAGRFQSVGRQSWGAGAVLPVGNKANSTGGCGGLPQGTGEFYLLKKQIEVGACPVESGTGSIRSVSRSWEIRHPNVCPVWYSTERTHLGNAWTHKSGMRNKANSGGCGGLRPGIPDSRLKRRTPRSPGLLTERTHFRLSGCQRAIYGTKPGRNGAPPLTPGYNKGCGGFCGSALFSV